ncbi:MAG: hypothetical protein J5959_04770 [Butyrivibrio sp.]|nr:hypothetical protein [Butyrivibrio sp.]
MPLEGIYQIPSNTCLETDRAGISIVLVRDEDIDSEQYVVMVRCDGLGERKGKYLAVSAYDALGFIYGIYHISRHFLKVGDFWFWISICPIRMHCFI